MGDKKSCHSKELELEQNSKEESGVSFGTRKVKRVCSSSVEAIGDFAHDITVSSRQQLKEFGYWERKDKGINEGM